MIKRFLKQLLRGNDSNSPRVSEVTGDYPCYADPDLPFESLNPLQSCFRDKYRKDMHCVVESGTGTGKTALTYIASRYFLDEGQRVVLAAPTRELVKSLYREAVGIWGAKIAGLNTGNDKNVADKYFIVTTPEGYISALRSQKEWTRAGLLIVDEAHKILDPERGCAIDVAITMHRMNRGKVLLMSGTFRNKGEIADMLRADLFVSKYRRTKLNVIEIHCPDDMESRKVTGKRLPPVSAVPTISGHLYNRSSVRLKTLKEKILAKHEGESVLIFVPTKDTGFCLSESLITGFHCADIEEEEKDRLVAGFRAGSIKTLIATNTLQEGLNTPADVVIVFGTRRGSYYLDTVDVNQMFGRAGRGRDEATVYLIGDKIELFNAKKDGLVKSLPLPTECMCLTVLALNASSKEDISAALTKTYAAHFLSKDKIGKAVDRYLRFLKACNILYEKNGLYSLTKEGALLARYYISPKAYIEYVATARKIADSSTNLYEKGCILLSLIIQIYGQECPPKFEKDMLMKLIPLELDKEISASRSGNLMYYLSKPSAIPIYLPYQLRDAERWIGMLGDMERYGVHQKSPGRDWLQGVLAALKAAAAKYAGKKKPVQQRLLS